MRKLTEFQTEYLNKFAETSGAESLLLWASRRISDPSLTKAVDLYLAGPSRATPVSPPTMTTRALFISSTAPGKNVLSHKDVVFADEGTRVGRMPEPGEARVGDRVRFVRNTRNVHVSTVGIAQRYDGNSRPAKVGDEVYIGCIDGDTFYIRTIDGRIGCYFPREDVVFASDHHDSRGGLTPKPDEVKVGDRLRFIQSTNGCHFKKDGLRRTNPGDEFVVHALGDCEFYAYKIEAAYGDFAAREDVIFA